MQTATRGAYRVANQQRMAARRALEWIGASKAQLVLDMKYLSSSFKMHLKICFSIDDFHKMTFLRPLHVHPSNATLYENCKNTTRMLLYMKTHELSFYNLKSLLAMWWTSGVLRLLIGYTGLISTIRVWGHGTGRNIQYSWNSQIEKENISKKKKHLNPSQIKP